MVQKLEHSWNLSAYAGITNDPKIFILIQEFIISCVETNQWFNNETGHHQITIIISAYLDNRFPEGWIGRKGFVESPTRSPD